jgi:predicted phosphoribosyltransferase
MFTDRKEAGMLLAKQLELYRNDKNALVLAIPRGGIIPANEISKTLNLPLEIVLVKKISAPGNKEFAIGAVSLDDYIITSKSYTDERFLESEIRRLRKIIREQMAYFLGNRKPLELEGKKLIIVDDGIATGATLELVIATLKRKKADQIIVAVPVAPADALARIKHEVTKVICLATPFPFQSVGQHYSTFEQVEDETVKEILEEQAKLTEIQ